MPDQDPVVKSGDQSPETSPSLPKTGFFQGDRMAKFVEEAGLMGEQPDAPKAEAKPAEKKPCATCPGGEKEAKPGTPAAAAKPWKTLKVAGKEVQVKDEKHLEELAQQGVDYTQKRQRDAEWEKDLSAREQKLLELTPFLQKIADNLDKSGKPATAANVEAERKKLADEGDVPEDAEEPLDPVARDQIKALKDELKELRSKVAPTVAKAEADKQAQVQATISRVMDTELDKARTEFPFDDVLDEETGKKISDDVFSGIFVRTVLDDDAKSKADPSFKMKTLAEYMKDTAKQVYRLQQAYAGGNGNGKATSESIKESHPEIYEEIAQAAVADYLAKQREIPGSPRARSEAARTDRPSSKSKISGLDDAMERASQDPEIEAEIHKVGQRHRA